MKKILIIFMTTLLLVGNVSAKVTNNDEYNIDAHSLENSIDPDEPSC